MTSFYYGMRDILVGIATGRGLIFSGVLIPPGARDFLFSETVQTDCGAHLASYSVGTMCFLGDKATRVWSSPLATV